MTKVSVIVPAYNAEKTIKKCIDSIMNQTFDDYEVIVINDGSTDNTKDLLDMYKNNPKLRVINKKNGGIGAARNDGIKEAKGDYITFVDSDDYVDKKILESFYNFAIKNSLDVVTSSYKKVISGKIVDWPSIKYKIGNIKTSPKIIFSIEYAPWAKMFKRDLLINHNIKFVENKKYEDIPFVCRALLYSKLTGYLKDAHYYYVVHKKSETTTMDERVFDILDALKMIKNDYRKEYYLKDEINYLLIDKTTNYMLQQRVQKNRKIRKQFINEGYKFLNENVKNWKSNKYYKETSKLKRFIKNHKFILKGYCKIYGIFR